MPYQTFSPADVAPAPPQTWSNIKIQTHWVEKRRPNKFGR